MNENGNGAAPQEAAALPTLPPEAQAAAVKQVAQLVEANVLLLMGCAVRGIVVTMQQIPANILLPAIARGCGLALAQTLAGNPLDKNLEGRRDAKRAFEDGMAKVPSLQPPGIGVPQPPMTASFKPPQKA